MIKKLQGLLRSRRRKPNNRRQFNRPLLEQRRDDVYVLMHQQMGGLR